MTAPTKPPHTPSATTPDGAHLHTPVIDWFEENARDLPGGAPTPAPGA